MTTLADFLLARIAEDEAVARRIAAVGSCEPAYHPARVLAECAAKRAIVADLQKWDDATEADLGDDRFYGWLNGVEQAAQHLAAPYADHPDYDPAWKVEP